MKEFKKSMFRKGGFIVLQYADGREEKVYANPPERHYPRCYSFLAITPNTRDKKGCSDFGRYVWVNHIGCGSERPVKWRRMTPDEVKDFRKHLYQFDRPKDLTWSKAKRA
jgi:hypothetical protein